MKTNLLKTSLSIASLAGMLAAGSACADSISFDLGLGNVAISGYAGPYANVVVNRTDSTHATITFTSLTGGGNVFLLGDGGSVAVNVNASSWNLGTISGLNGGTGFTPGPWSDGGAGNEDGWGSFNQTINSFDGYTHSSDTISFTLANTSGTWASAANVLTGNASGYLAAAHIFVAASPASGGANGGDALATGFATGDGSGGGGGEPGVPDGGTTLTLLGFALAGLGTLSRKFRKS